MDRAGPYLKKERGSQRPYQLLVEDLEWLSYVPDKNIFKLRGLGGSDG